VLLHATRTVCPACRQVQRHQAFGAVRVHGIAAAEREAVLRRVWNVARRAAFNQPERRLVLIREGADGIEIETTSQKLAHRIACELAKAFGGRSRFAWSDRGGRLLARWDRQGDVHAGAG
jgi:NMD protein affecting ribosome stability and mRNA decay